MRWYDVFSLFYDRALEDAYAPFRGAAIEALRLKSANRVLDLPCGTGQSLAELVDAVGPAGQVLGVDLSNGMLNRANKRVEANGWDNITLRQAAVADVDVDFVHEHLDATGLDGVLCALGLTAFPDWQASIGRMASLLRPGGRLVVLDVYAAERTLQTRSVELVAQADLSRRVWEAMHAHLDQVERTVLPAEPKLFGGELYVASGVAPD